ncbi:GntR family transcriptional regulator [Enterococcus sp. PF1-24]|uniref:GntR family transcriptional regulator n=1 Tax=unclassified Enterococcus TaxID=2608891 RepID=UPI002473F4EE|nr:MULTISPECIES: GntR family transcriptional regulator [unclassified Enterococcus]MDH6363414.1 GntR family transcriptional regulator [Enterococcus sp. PFB1-1]MDH6400508.1 GntR family transcriptional regulator [Enterococcus sp. PF1-24]
MKRARILYLEIVEKIKNDIISGRYPVGSFLPTEKEFEEMFGVSKITVRKAIELLASDEYVAKKSGKGTTVLSDRPYNKLSKAASFSQVLQKSNLKLEKQVLDLEIINLPADDKLREHFGARVLRFRRIYLLEGVPYIYFSHYLPVALAKLALKEFAEESLYRLLKIHGYEIAFFEDDFLAVQLTAEEQEILAAEEMIGIRRVRRSFAEDGSVVEYSQAIYDTAKHPYHIEYET